MPDMTFQEIEQSYGVRFWRGMQCQYEGKNCRVTGTFNGCVVLRCDGDGYSIAAHPHDVAIESGGATPDIRRYSPCAG